MAPVPFSVLDLSPIVEDGSARTSLMNSLALAQRAEELGYNRYWLAEHHGMPGIASAATAVVIAHVAHGTSRIRVGAGGIMLPNHAPLLIAEQFGTLESLFPGRIDLGLGRAPGSDQVTSRALRRNFTAGGDSFPGDVRELMAYFEPANAGKTVQAVPGAGLKIPIWILGSSLFGAQLAAELGLPYAFASHFAPTQMMEAIELYRRAFRPSAQLQKPYVMLGYGVYASDSQEEAELLVTSVQQAYVGLRTGQPAQLKPPVAGYLEQLPPQYREILAQTLSCSAVGTAKKITADIEAFLKRTKANELMITSQIYDHKARVHSYEITAKAHKDLGLI